MSIPFAIGASAPERIAGALYQYRGYRFAGGTIGEIDQTYPVALFEDGTYVFIYGGGSGRWSYERVSADSAVITRIEGGNTLRDTLLFATDSAGTWSRPFSLDRDLTFLLFPFAGRSRLVNSSSRAYVRAGERALLGFVVAQSGTMVLVRAVGPGLRPFGVSGSLATTALAVRGSSGSLLLQNIGWTTPDAARPARSPSEADRIRGLSRFFGAFALAEASADSAVQWIAEGGNYVAEVTSPDITASGEVLLEVYTFP